MYYEEQDYTQGIKPPFLISSNNPANSSNNIETEEHTTQLGAAYTALSESFKEEATTGWKLATAGYEHTKNFFIGSTYLTADGYEQSPYKVAGVSYPDGVAENIAKIRYEEHQNKLHREKVLAKLYAEYPKTAMAGSFIGGLGGAIVDPVFWAGATGITLLCPPAGVAATTSRLVKLGRWGTTAIKDVVLGMEVGAVGGIEHYAKGKAYNEEVSAADIVTSSLFGGMFGMGVTATRGLVGAIRGRFISPASDLAIKIKAISQLEEGMPVNVTPYFKEAVSKESYVSESLEEITKAKKLNPDAVLEYEKLEAIAKTKDTTPPAFEEFIEVEKAGRIEEPKAPSPAYKSTEEKIEAQVRDYASTNKRKLAEGLQAFLAGVTGRGIKARDSVAGYLKARKTDTLLTFWEELKKRGVADYFSSKNPLQEIEIAKAIRGEYTESKSAMQVAEVFKPLQENLRVTINNLGGNIQEKEGYITHFSHDPLKAGYTHETPLERLKYRLSSPFAGEVEINEKTFKRWKDTHLPLLDHEKTFGAIGEKEKEKALRNMYNRIVARERHKDTDYKKTGFSGIASRWGRSQFFVYKDAESFIKANRIYGGGNIYDAMIGTLKDQSQTIALVEKFGLSPKETFENVLERLKRTDGLTPKGIDKLEKQKLVFDNLFNDSPYDTTAVLTNKILTWEYLTKAGNITIASFNDVVHQTAVQQRLFGKSALGSFLDTLRTQPKEFLKAIARSLGKENISRNELSVTAELARVMALDLHSRYSDAPINRLAQIMNTASGIHAWDTASIHHATICTARTLFLNARFNFEKLNSDLQKTLLQYGIKKRDWELIRKNPFRDKYGKGYITVDTGGYSKESIAQYLGKAVDKITPEEISDVQKQMRFKLLTMNQDVVDFYRLTPDAVERALPLMRSKDFLTRTFMQFKGYPIALTRRILSLVMENSIAGFKEQGFSGMLQGFKKDLIPAATYIGGGLALGYATNSLLRLTQGKAPLDPREPDTWKKAAMYSGVGGLYTTALEHLIAPHGGNMDILASLAGSTWADINHLGQIGSKWVSGKKAGYDFYKLISGNIPLVNLPYTKEAFNYLIGWRAFEFMAPSAFRKMIKREKGNWLVDPRDYLGA